MSKFTGMDLRQGHSSEEEDVELIAIKDIKGVVESSSDTNNIASHILIE